MGYQGLGLHGQRAERMYRSRVISQEYERYRSCYRGSGPRSHVSEFGSAIADSVGRYFEQACRMPPCVSAADRLRTSREAVTRS